MQYTTLTNLVKAKAEIIWSTRCQAAFEAVKALLCSFKLKVDGSQTGFGVVLQQENNEGIECPVSFFSWKFKCNKYQQNYDICVLQHFKVYAGSDLTPIRVFTNGSPLVPKLLQILNQRLMGWALFWQPDNLDIRHISGKYVTADAISCDPLCQLLLLLC